MGKYDDLSKALRCCASHTTKCLECPFKHKDDCFDELKLQAADAIEELSKMVSADDTRAYLDRDHLMNTLMEHKKSFDLKDRYGDYGMGFSEAIKVVAMTYPVYMPEPQKEET